MQRSWMRVSFIISVAFVYSACSAPSDDEGVASVEPTLVPIQPPDPPPLPLPPPPVPLDPLSWSDPAMIGTAFNGVTRPVVAFDSDGYGLMIWHGLYGGEGRVWSARFTPGQGWDQPVSVSAAASVKYFQLAVLPDGRGLACWSQYDGISPTPNPMMCWYDPSTGWATPEPLSISNTLTLVLKVDPTGVLFALWIENMEELWSRRFESGSGWSPSELVALDDYRVEEVTLAFGGDGLAMVAWNQDDSIFSSLYEPGTGWGAPQAVESSNGVALEPVLWGDPDGNFIAIWRQDPGLSVCSNRYEAGSGWGGAGPLDSWAGASTELSLVGNEAGNAIAVWRQYDGQNQRIAACEFDPATGWGAATLFVTSGEPKDIQIAMSPNGRAILTWRVAVSIQAPANMSGVITTNSIWGTQYVPGSGWEFTQLLEVMDGITAYEPAAACDPEGNGAVAWVFRNMETDEFTIWSVRLE